MCKYSFVICNYNMRHSLRESLDSLIDQLPDESEIVVVDGGSTDESHDILEEYEEEYDFFRFQVSEEGTLGHDRNLGTELARGDILFHQFDCDEKLKEKAVQKSLEQYEGVQNEDGTVFVSTGAFFMGTKNAFEEIPYGDVYRAEDREQGRNIDASDKYKLEKVSSEIMVEDVYQTPVLTEMKKHWIAIYSEFVNGLGFWEIMRVFVFDHDEVSFKSRVYHFVFVILNYFRYKVTRILDRFR